MGFPTEFFTVLFALPRMTGWMAHWNEFIVDPDNKIVRPRQIYLGERARNYTRMEDRQQEDLAAYKMMPMKHNGTMGNRFELYTIHDRDE